MTVAIEDNCTQPLVAYPCNFVRPLGGRPKFVANTPRRETSNPSELDASLPDQRACLESRP